MDTVDIGLVTFCTKKMNRSGMVGVGNLFFVFRLLWIGTPSHQQVACGAVLLLYLIDPLSSTATEGFRYTVRAVLSSQVFRSPFAHNHKGVATTH